MNRPIFQNDYEHKVGASLEAGTEVLRRWFKGVTEKGNIHIRYPFDFIRLIFQDMGITEFHLESGFDEKYYRYFLEAKPQQEFQIMFKENDSLEFAPPKMMLIANDLVMICKLMVEEQYKFYVCLELLVIIEADVSNIAEISFKDGNLDMKLSETILANKELHNKLNIACKQYIQTTSGNQNLGQWDFAKEICDLLEISEYAYKPLEQQFDWQALI